MATLKEKETKSEKLSCLVIRGNVLGVNIYRGYEKLSVLADISKGDIYDKKNNKLGTQRDLSPTHAKHAFEYIKNSNFGFWPELFLCARENDVLTYRPLSTEMPDMGILEIDLNKISKSQKISISRIDGNHRLHYADGKAKGFSSIDKTVSFCLAYNLTLEEEIQLFKDINRNQMPMNTSHLDGIEVRLTPQEELKRRTPDLYISQMLGNDVKSPLHNRIFEGGKKPAGVDIPLRGLRTGIQYMLSRSTQLPRLVDAEAQYIVIRNYFGAIKKWQPKAWSKPKEYILLRGAGLWAICFLGAQVIDRALLNDKFDVDNMHTILNSGKDWDWGTKGNFIGYSGRAGALEISNKVARHLKDTNQISTEQLFRQIMSTK